MRKLIGALFMCATAAQAGTFNVSLTNAQLTLTDTNLSDGIAAYYTVDDAAQFSALTSPINYGGSFWAGTNSIVEPPSYTLTGKLSAYSKLRYTVDSELVANIVPGAAPGGGSLESASHHAGFFAYTLNGSFSSMEFMPWIYSWSTTETGTFILEIENTWDQETDYSLGFSGYLFASSEALPVPEPSTYALASLGLLAIALRRRFAAHK